MFPAVTEPYRSQRRGVFSASLGEFVMAAVLFFAKDFPRMRRSQAARTWDPFDVDWAQGKTLGIVGYGDIGRAAAERARAFGMKILALRRNLEAARQDPRWTKRSRSSANRPHGALRLRGVAAPLTGDARPRRTRDRGHEADRRAHQREAGRSSTGSARRGLQQGRIRERPRRVHGACLFAFYGFDNVLLSPTVPTTRPGGSRPMHFFLENLERFRQPALLNLVDKAAVTSCQPEGLKVAPVAAAPPP
jgi:hypothetical protein